MPASLSRRTLAMIKGNLFWAAIRPAVADQSPQFTLPFIRDDSKVQTAEDGWQGPTRCRPRSIMLRVRGRTQRDKPLTVTCGSGYRFSFAASLPTGTGRTGVANVGDVTGWKHVGYPLTA